MREYCIREIHDRFPRWCYLWAMFKKIAVALDGSESAQQAFGVALQLAQTELAELGICSVVDPIAITGTTPPSPAANLLIRDMEIEARRIVAIAIESAQNLGVTAGGQTRNGVPAFEFLSYVDRFGADLIVMGT